MKDDLNNIDKLFKAAIDGYEEEPSPASWDAIDKGLDNSNIVSIRKKYANLKKWVVVLLLLLSGGVAYELHSAFSHNAITASAGSSNTNNSIGDKTTQGIKQNSVTSNKSINTSLESNKNTVVMSNDEKDKYASANQAALSSSENINTTSEINDKTKTTTYTAHNFIKVHTKAKFSSTITNGEVSGLDGVADIKASLDHTSAEDKISTGFNSTILLKPLPIEVFTHPDAASLIQPGTLQDNILPKNSINSIASTSNNKGTIFKPSRFSATVFYSPSLPSDLIEDDDDDNNRNNNNGNDAEHIKKGEHQSSYSLGSLIEYSLNKHWSIQSGLTFIQKVSHINSKTIYAEDAGNGNIGYLFDFSSGYSYLSSKSANLAVGDSAQASRSINVLQYLSIPLQAKYTIERGKFSFNLSLGAAYNILLKGTLETEVANDSSVEKEIINKITGLKSDYVSGLIGIGAEYRLTKKINVCFNPSFDVALSSITQGAPVKSYPSFFAFAAGLHIKL